jgi:hypothetical protein
MAVSAVLDRLVNVLYVRMYGAMCVVEADMVRVRVCVVCMLGSVRCVSVCM